MSDVPVMRTRPRPTCYVCGAHGEPLYAGMVDRLFGTGGAWNLARCPRRECGLLWLDPMPIEEDIAMAYQSYFTHGPPPRRPYARPLWDWLPARLQRFIIAGHLFTTYGHRRIGYKPWKRWFARLSPLMIDHIAWHDFAFMHMPPKPGGRLLDVGCGAGDLMTQLIEAGWRAEGLDVDPAAIRFARSRGLTAHEGTLFSQCFPDASFDAVTMSHVIEHVHDPSALLRETLRILKPGGAVSIVTPNTNSFCHDLFRFSWAALDPPRHLHLFNTRTLPRLVEQAGFREVRARTTLHDIRAVAHWSRCIERSGRADINRLAPAGRSAWADWIMYRGWLTMRNRPDRGDELAVTGRR